MVKNEIYAALCYGFPGGHGEDNESQVSRAKGASQNDDSRAFIEQSMDFFKAMDYRFDNGHAFLPSSRGPLEFDFFAPHCRLDHPFCAATQVRKAVDGRVRLYMCCRGGKYAARHGTHLIAKATMTT